MELPKYEEDKKETLTEKTEESFVDLNKEELHKFSSFFYLLARFDYEDKQKEKSEFKTGSLGVQLPKGSVLSSDI